MNYKLTIAFDGKNYHGWQFQKNAPTVQGEMTRIAESFFSSEVSVTGCSRTDSGVHASNYVCSVKCDKAVPVEAVVRGMNALLPPNIAVKACTLAPEDFHPRYDCKGKEYQYRILNSQCPDPFLASYAYRFPIPLDVEKMREDARRIEGEHEFDSFMASGSKIVDTKRCVFSTKVEREGELILFSISADGFLYNMVRIIVGTLIDLNLGRNTLTMEEIISGRNRRLAGFTAEPCGLYLNRVDY